LGKAASWVPQLESGAHETKSPEGRDGSGGWESPTIAGAGEVWASWFRCAFLGIEDLPRVQSNPVPRYGGNVEAWVLALCHVQYPW
jgi:hypothetical protein